MVPTLPPAGQRASLLGRKRFRPFPSASVGHDVPFKTSACFHDVLLRVATLSSSSALKLTQSFSEFQGRGFIRLQEIVPTAVLFVSGTEQLRHGPCLCWLTSRASQQMALVVLGGCHGYDETLFTSTILRVQDDCAALSGVTLTKALVSFLST